MSYWQLCHNYPINVIHSFYEDMRNYPLTYVSKYSKNEKGIYDYKRKGNKIFYRQL